MSGRKNLICSLCGENFTTSTALRDHLKDEHGEAELRTLDIEPWYPREMFRVFDDMWSDFRRGMLAPWRPWRLERPQWGSELLDRRLACTDLIDTGDSYQVCAEVPGIPKDKINITVTENEIEISAKAENEREKEEEGYLFQERGYSEIYRKMLFPMEVVPEKAEATLNHGLLEVNIPKKMPTPEVKKRTVPVK
jgi:HSP20 family protein